MKSRFFLVIFFSLFLSVGFGQRKRKAIPPPPVSVFLIGKEYNGFFDFSYNEANGSVHLKVDRKDHVDKPFLYVNGLSAGIGSNDIGLDRGQLGNERVVYFSKMGNKLMLIQPNLEYRSTSDNALEQASIAQAFAQSVLFGFPIVESTTEYYIIDMTSFLMQDAHGVAKRLKDSKQGNYSVDKSRSAISLDRTKNFPDNSEFDVLLTFSGNPQGRLIHSVSDIKSIWDKLLTPMMDSKAYVDVAKEKKASKTSLVVEEQME